MSFNRKTKKARREAAKHDVSYAIAELRALDAQLLHTSSCLLAGAR